MRLIADILRILAFRADALRKQAERRSFAAATVFFTIGYLAYALVRNSVYSSLPEIAFRQFDPVNAFLDLNIVQVLLFLLLVYVPVLILLSYALSGDSLGLSFSRQEYRAHMSALLTLWGSIFLITAPLQWLVPHFLIFKMLEISFAILVRSILLVVYTVWALKSLNYLSAAQAIVVFVLSWVTFPILYLLTAFFFALPFFFIIPLIYLGYQWIRNLSESRVNERAFQQNLHTLTLNPKDADAQHQLGLIHLKRMNLETARRYFENALKIDPADPDYHYSLGRTYEFQGQWTPALEQYEEVYRVNPEHGLGDIFREVGKAYLHTGNAEKAVEFLTHFLKTRTSDPEGRYWLAVAFQRLGDAEQMRFQLNTVLEQARSNPRFFRKENREWIYRARSMIRDSKLKPRG
jgi:tetratricopeptide (TPR) repeat protein